MRLYAALQASATSDAGKALAEEMLGPLQQADGQTGNLAQRRARLHRGGREPQRGSSSAAPAPQHHALQARPSVPSTRDGHTQHRGAVHGVARPPLRSPRRDRDPARRGAQPTRRADVHVAQVSPRMAADVPVLREPRAWDPRPMHKVFRITLDDALPMLDSRSRQGRGDRSQADPLRLDDGGNVLALHRLPGARLTGVEISIAKAFTAAGHERATHKFNEPPNGPALPGNEAFGITHMLPGQVRHLRRWLPDRARGPDRRRFGVSGGNGEAGQGRGRCRPRGLRRRTWRRTPADLSRRTAGPGAASRPPTSVGVTNGRRRAPPRRGRRRAARPHRPRSRDRPTSPSRSRSSRRRRRRRRSAR